MSELLNLGTERLVINTGPLIALESAGVLDVLARLPFEVVCPSQVVDELAAGPRKGPLPGWLHVLPLAASLDRVALASLDPGEAAVIQLAGEQGISLVCIDEKKGRLFAGCGRPFVAFGDRAHARDRTAARIDP